MAVIVLKAKTGLSFKLKKIDGSVDVVNLKGDGFINNVEEQKLEALKEHAFFKRAVDKGFILFSTNSNNKINKAKVQNEINASEKKRQDAMSNQTTAKQ